MGNVLSFGIDMQESFHKIEFSSACPNVSVGTCQNLDVHYILMESLGTCEDCDGHIPQVVDKSVECPVCLETKDLSVRAYKCDHVICIDCFRGPPFQKPPRKCTKYLEHENEFCLHCACDEMDLWKAQTRFNEIRKILDICPLCRTSLS